MLIVAEGKPNREVGAQLFLSPKTFEWHLGHIYSKLGVRSRAELIRALAERESPQAALSHLRPDRLQACLDNTTCGLYADLRERRDSNPRLPIGRPSRNRLIDTRFSPEGSTKGSIPTARCGSRKCTRKKKPRFAGLLQSPLTDSNRRPLLTMHSFRQTVATGGNGFGFVRPRSRRSAPAERDTHRLLALPGARPRQGPPRRGRDRARPRAREISRLPGRGRAAPRRRRAARARAEPQARPARLRARA